MEHMLARFGDRMVRIAEDTLGEELDARIARIQTHPNEAGVDPFGFDPAVARYALAVSAFLHRFYFRTQVFGAEHVPTGRALVIANHSGQIPMDGLLIGTSLMLDAEPPRFPRSMVERWTAELPFVSVLFPRCGQVVGSPDNARRLLENDDTLVVFPEGVRGISKTWDKRYQLAQFGLGFMRLALETNTPIVPVGVVGGEEQLISVANLKSVGSVFGMPALPVIPQLGRKIWTSNAPVADYCVLFAITDAEKAAAKRGGISAFICSTKASGFNVQRIIRLFGHIGGDEAELNFDDLAVEPWQLVGDLHQGFKAALYGVSLGRIYNSARAVGITSLPAEALNRKDSVGRISAVPASETGMTILLAT